MRLVGTFSGRDFTESSGSQPEFERIFIFEPTEDDETQLDLFLCEDFPHPGDIWTFDVPEHHSQLSIDYAAKLRCYEVVNEGKKSTVAEDQANHFRDYWEVRAKYRLFEPTILPVASGTISPDYNPTDAPWSQPPTVSLKYANVNEPAQSMYRASLPIEVNLSAGLNKTMFEYWTEDLSGKYLGHNMHSVSETSVSLPITNIAGEPIKIDKQETCPQITIEFNTTKNIEPPTISEVTNSENVTTHFGSKLKPQTLKASPALVSQKWYTIIYNKSTIKNLVDLYKIEHPHATEYEIKQYEDSLKAKGIERIPYYNYSVTFTYKKSGWAIWKENVGSKKQNKGIGLSANFWQQDFTPIFEFSQVDTYFQDGDPYFVETNRGYTSLEGYTYMDAVNNKHKPTSSNPVSGIVRNFKGGQINNVPLKYNDQNNEDFHVTTWHPKESNYYIGMLGFFPYKAVNLVDAYEPLLSGFYDRDKYSDWAEAFLLF